MIHKLKAIVKSSRLLYLIYYYLGSFFIRILGLFVKTNRNQALFVSYGGQKYDDSPRFIYEYLRANNLDTKITCVWAFTDPSQYPEITNSVKIDTVKYFYTALQSAYWITNSSASRGLNFKKKSTKDFFFTHGMTAIKKIGNDIAVKKDTFRSKFKENRSAVFIEGKYETEILVNAWNYPAESFFNTGLPRNDDLLDISSSEVSNIKKKLGVDEDKKVILYAPTFREHSRNSSKENIFSLPFHFETWEKLLGSDYVFVITAHYEISKLINMMQTSNFVINAFKYPVLNDLIKIADILISDYSSIVFDFSILDRPIFCFGFDYDTYIAERGVYTDLNQLFSHGVIRSEDELMDAIKNIDYSKECEFTRKNIKEKYLSHYDGNASSRAAKIIFSDLLSQEDNA